MLGGLHFHELSDAVIPGRCLRSRWSPCSCDTVVTVVVTSIVGMAVLFPLTTQLKKRFGNTPMRERAMRPNGASSG